jgi:DNA-binding transcriptional ArsR family regulator
MRSFAGIAGPASIALSVEWFTLVARRLRAVAEPSRMRLLVLLEEGEASVEALGDALGMTPQRTSKHLKVLYTEGILARRQEGNHAFYSLADYSAITLVQAALASMTGWVDEQAELARPDRTL